MSRRARRRHEQIAAQAFADELADDVISGLDDLILHTEARIAAEQRRRRAFVELRAMLDDWRARQGLRIVDETAYMAFSNPPDPVAAARIAELGAQTLTGLEEVA